jgi:ribonuclease HII
LIEAGVDEAGRGPLAGPVVSAAVILSKEFKIEALDDSKKLSEKKRNLLEKEIKANALAWSVASASVEEIDELNILQASLLSMKRAVLKLEVQPQKVYFDGNHIPIINLPSEAIVKGDTLIKSIMAASILAKVYRDRVMEELDKSYPEYGFKKHKGYPTKMHLDALKSHGPSKIHRLSFKPVKILIS